MFTQVFKKVWPSFILCLGFSLLNIGSFNQAIAFKLDLTRFFVDTHSCPPLSYDTNLTQLETTNNQVSFGKIKSLCLSAQRQLNIALASGTMTEEKAKAAVAVISSLRHHKDYRNATINGLRLYQILEDEIEVEERASLRFAILQSLFAASEELGFDKDPQWLYLGLGIAQEDSDLAPLLSLKKFAEEFPQSEKCHQVNQMHDKMVGDLIKREQEIARSLNQRDEYWAAIAHIESLYQYDFVHKHPLFWQLLVTVIKLEVDFAHHLRTWRPFNKWSDERLKNHVVHEPGAPINRDQLCRHILEKAHVTLNYMKLSLPTDHPLLIEATKIINYVCMPHAK